MTSRRSTKYARPPVTDSSQPAHASGEFSHVESGVKAACFASSSSGRFARELSARCSTSSSRTRSTSPPEV